MTKKINHYKSLFISDVHLGTKDCKSEELINFLENNSCENLYLVGDIIDGWKIFQNKLKWKQSHTDVLKCILDYSKNKTKVIYIIGNHDEFIRPFLSYRLYLGSVEICNHITHEGADGKKYLIIHGDIFDGISNIAPFIAFLGDRAYDFILSLNSKFNWFRHKLGFGYWSFSKFLKNKVKQAVNFIYKFEHNLVDYCKKRKCDGIITGHIHNPDIKFIDNILYLNDGDFVESISVLAETYDGDWIIINLKNDTWVPLKILPTNSKIILDEKESLKWFTNKKFNILKYTKK